MKVSIHTVCMLLPFSEYVKGRDRLNSGEINTCYGRYQDGVWRKREWPFERDLPEGIRDDEASFGLLSTEYCVSLTVAHLKILWVIKSTLFPG